MGKRFTGFQESCLQYAVILVKNSKMCIYEDEVLYQINAAGNQLV